MKVHQIMPEEAARGACQVNVADAGHDLPDLSLQPVHFCTQRSHHIPSCSITKATLTMLPATLDRFQCCRQFTASYPLQ